VWSTCHCSAPARTPTATTWPCRTSSASAGVPDTEPSTSPRYRASDDRWFWLVGLEGNRHWPGVVKALGREDLATDERFATGKARRGHVRELIAVFDEEFALRPLDEWAERFDAEGVWWAPVQTLAEVSADPQAEAVGAFVEQPGMGDAPMLRTVATPVAFWGVDDKPRGGAPTLGEHTDEVLRELN
jgi:crotonobetainyl-CoA:carnitine CoA-transferase CaiB-like acyl-CoA transferase